MNINPFSGNLAGQLKAMQGKMESAQSGLAEKTIEAQDELGFVKVVITGHQEVSEVSLPGLTKHLSFSGDGELDVLAIEILQDAIKDAVNQAIAQSKALAAKELGEILRLSGLGGL